MVVRSSALTVLAALLICPSARGQRACEKRLRPPLASVDAVFLAQVKAVEPYTEMIRVDRSRSTWPMVRFLLHPRQGWKLDPRKATEMWEPDTNGVLMFSVQPQQAPPLQSGSWALVYMRVPVDMVITKPANSQKIDTTLEAQNGFLEVVTCGLRAVTDTSLGKRLYGPPAWRSDHR